MPFFKDTFRIEPRLRKEDFDRPLKAEIHDPLWMLTRQWQFGEFQAEDAGSPILASFEVESSKITHFQAADGTIHNVAGKRALEPLVESQKQVFDLKVRLDAAQYWQQLLETRDNKLHEEKKWEKHLVLYQKLYPIILPELESDSDSLFLEQVKMHSNKQIKGYLSFASLRCFDGVKLLNDLYPTQNIPNGPLKEGLQKIYGSDFSLLNELVTSFILWFRQKYGDPNHQPSNSWIPGQLEYKFACAAPGADSPTILKAEEYFHGNLKWHSMDIYPVGDEHQELAKKVSESISGFYEVRNQTVIPTEVYFPGMPKSRWWEMEEGEVNFAKGIANTTDISKLLVTQFALQYSNDWYLIPIELNVGTLNKITGIVVTDTFGQETTISSTSEESSPDWTGWQFFKQDYITSELKTDYVEDRLLLPPSLIDVKESEPLEWIYFIRDEMANLVWAIESSIPNGLGQGMDGHMAANELKNFLKSLDSQATSLPVSPEAVLKYTLFKNTTSENWIPFIPTPVENDHRSIRLQRAALPRFFKGRYMHIRPRTALLRHGLFVKDNPQLPLAQEDAPRDKEPYFINEEEILKTGIMVTGRYQRSRWFNGKELHWYGYQKSIARTKESASVGFDILEPIAPQEEYPQELETLRVPVSIIRGEKQVEFFVIDTNGRLRFRRLDQENESWANLGGNLEPSSQPYVLIQNDKLYVFARSTYDTLLYRCQGEEGWEAWKDLGGEMVSDPSAVAWGNNSIDVYVRHSDGSLYYKRGLEDKWDEWARVGKFPYGFVNPNTKIQAANTGFEEVPIIVSFWGKHHPSPKFQQAIVHAQWRTNKNLWGGPNEIPMGDDGDNLPNFTGPFQLLAGKNPLWEIYYFIRGEDGAIWSINYDERRPPDQRYSKWISLGGDISIVSQICAIQIDKRWIYIFARDNNQKLIYRRKVKDTWEDWVETGIKISNNPVASRLHHHQISIAFVDEEGEPQHHRLDIPELLGEGQTTVVRGKEGTWDLFWVDSQGNIQSQTWEERSSHSAIIGTGAVPRTKPAVFLQNERLEIFVHAASGNILYNQHNGQKWLGWEDFGGSATSPPVVASWGAEHLDIYIRNVDGSIGFRRRLSGNWADWKSIREGQYGFVDAGTSLKVAYRGDSQHPIELYFNGQFYGHRPEQNVYRYILRNFEQNDKPSWIGPYPNPSREVQEQQPQMKSSPCVTIWKTPDNPRFYAVYFIGIGVEGELWFLSFDKRLEGNNQWSTWRKLSGTPHQEAVPAIIVQPDEQLFIFLRSPEDELTYNQLIKGSWIGWKTLGTDLTGNPEVVQWNDSTLAIFGKGTDSTIKQWFLKTSEI